MRDLRERERERREQLNMINMQKQAHFRLPFPFYTSFSRCIVLVVIVVVLLLLLFYRRLKKMTGPDRAQITRINNIIYTHTLNYCLLHSIFFSCCCCCCYRSLLTVRNRMFL